MSTVRVFFPEGGSGYSLKPESQADCLLDRDGLFRIPTELWGQYNRQRAELDILVERVRAIESEWRDHKILAELIAGYSTDRQVLLSPQTGVIGIDDAIAAYTKGDLLLVNSKAEEALSDGREKYQNLINFDHILRGLTYRVRDNTPYAMILRPVEVWA